MQIIVKIKNPAKFGKLAFFILITGAILAISKTMIFVDSLNKGIILAIHLHNLLFEYIKDDRKKLIRTFTLILELDHYKEQILIRFLE